MGGDMNILFLCGGYYPNTSATGNCVHKIADKFSKEGHHVYVISKSADELPSEDEINGQKIYRVTNRRLTEAAILSKRQEGFGKRISLFLYKSRWAVTQLLWKDGLDSSLVREYVKKAQEVYKEVRFDAIVPCCMPAECLYAGYQLLDSCEGSRLFLLLYDPYSENVNFFRYKWSHKLREQFARNVEKRMFDASDVVFYVDNWKTYFKKREQTNAVRVEHPLVIEREKHPANLKNKTAINAIYQGEINQQMRPPQAMISAFEFIAENDSSISLHVCAYGNSVPEVVASTKRFPNSIIYYGKVQKDIADGYYDDADVAVVLANRNGTLVPSKIFECVASGYPIVYFYYSMEENAYKLLSKYPLVYFVDQNNMSEKNLSGLHSWILNNYAKRVEFDYICKEYSDATPDFVVDAIEKKVELAHEFKS